MMESGDVGRWREGCRADTPMIHTRAHTQTAGTVLFTVSAVCTLCSVDIKVLHVLTQAKQTVARTMDKIYTHTRTRARRNSTQAFCVTA